MKSEAANRPLFSRVVYQRNHSHLNQLPALVIDAQVIDEHLLAPGHDIVLDLHDT